MTVRELIAKLEACDPTKTVFIPAFIYPSEVSSVDESELEVTLG